MATDSVPADGDPRRLQAHSRHLAQRVRLAQRVTWFPLLVLAAVTFAAIPVDRCGHRVVNCLPSTKNSPNSSRLLHQASISR